MYVAHRVSRSTGAVRAVAAHAAVRSVQLHIRARQRPRAKRGRRGHPRNGCVEQGCGTIPDLGGLLPS
jgi:hypothetical protein